MKKQFEHPTMEACEFVVAARLYGSNENMIGNMAGAHDAGHGGAPCAMTASNGIKSCASPTNKNSRQHNPCY